MLKDKVLGFIGTGSMGEALIRGILTSKRLSPAQIIACDKDKKRLSHIVDHYGIEVFSRAFEVTKKADLVLIAVKPENLDDLLYEIKEELTRDKLLLSIVAGISTEQISHSLLHPCPIIRVMPNTPALVLEGISALCPGDGVSKEVLKEAMQIFESIGKVILIEDESLMDTVTGLSGSGPAFVFLFLEALSDGGVKMGLKRDVARILAAQTVLGSARLALETGRHFADLKDMVTSPGGTTITGISHLEKRGLRGIIIDAVEKATLRSRELSKKEGV